MSSFSRDGDGDVRRVNEMQGIVMKRINEAALAVPPLLILMVMMLGMRMIPG